MDMDWLWKALHDQARIRTWSDTTVLPQMRSSLHDEIARLVKAHSIALRVSHSFANREVVGLTGMRVLCRTSETINGSLFEIWHLSLIHI